MIVYVTIGNSDDKLTQREWSEFVHRVDGGVRHYGPDVHGFWLSASDSPWQNACWCVEANEDARWPLAKRLAAWRDELARIARQYRQDTIAFAVAETEFIKAAPSRATDTD